MYGGELQAFQALDIGRIAQANTTDPVPAVTIDPRTGADIQYSNAQLVPSPAAPLTLENGGSTQAVFNEFPGIGLADSTLKATFSEGIMADIWDLTIYCNNGIHGTSNTISLSGGTEADARSAALLFAKQRANLLGNDSAASQGTLHAENNGRASPAIEFYRIRDAQNPRVGDVQPVDLANGEPWHSTGTAPNILANAADPLFVSLNISLKATSGNIQKRTILKISGVPDQVVRRNSYDGTWIVGTSGITFDAHLRALLNFLTMTGGLALGISGHNGALSKDIDAWVPDPTTGEAKATIQTHGFLAGDQVRISGTKWWYLNRIWEVGVPDANTIVLRRSQMTTLQVPTTKGKALRVVTKDGLKLTTFYRFDRPSYLDASPQLPLPVRLTRKRPGAQYLPASFRGNRKKIKR